MHFVANKRGALLVALQFFLVGLLLFGFVTYFLFIIGMALIVAWAIACVLLFYRLNCLKVITENTILQVNKGKFFSVCLRVPIAHITGVHIFQTPIESKLKVCSVIVYTSGLTFILLGISYTNALELVALACGGGEY